MPRKFIQFFALNLILYSNTQEIATNRKLKKWNIILKHFVYKIMNLARYFFQYCTENNKGHHLHQCGKMAFGVQLYSPQKVLKTLNFGPLECAKCSSRQGWITSSILSSNQIETDSWLCNINQVPISRKPLRKTVLLPSRQNHTKE